MKEHLRLYRHPILNPLPEASVPFYFDEQKIWARPGEVISSALYAAGIPVMGYHHRDQGPQSIFCVNGQCSQCTVLVQGKPLKACMTVVQHNMQVESVKGLARLGADDVPVHLFTPEEVNTEVLILGGGPAGLCAAIELGKLDIPVLVVDDKLSLGGKLTLQTHQFFGSVADCWAGTRGIDIAQLLAQQIEQYEQVKIWSDSTAVGVFGDKKIGVNTPVGYKLISFKALLIALGAREKSLTFPGCDLPGVYGAGAFQTLVNRDLIKSSEQIFVLGGGNVGLIGAYHALQAGIDVVGLVEALPEVGGYKVHADKIRRLGVPIFTLHTVLSANPNSNREKLESVTIARVDATFNPQAGTEKTFGVDTLLIAVGLNPCDELAQKARSIGLPVYTAGDTQEIAEASAAIFSGRIVGRQIAQDLGCAVDIPSHWPALVETLRSRPGSVEMVDIQDLDKDVFPVIRCTQEIPCDPCQSVCPEHSIQMGDNIVNRPVFNGDCLGCARCVLVCPGLAINLVINNYDPKKEKALLMIPFEMDLDVLPSTGQVNTVDLEGKSVGQGYIIASRQHAEQNGRHLLLLEVPEKDKLQVAGFLLRETSSQVTTPSEVDPDPIVCRCERIRKSEIMQEIQAGVCDYNALKALTRVSMGGCGGKTCGELVSRIYREVGVDLQKVTPNTIRPLVAETPLGQFIKDKDNK